MLAHAVAEHVVLAPYTTLEVGGPARYFMAVADVCELPYALTWARQHGQPVTILGGGSNVVVSDAGIAGLVVHLRPGGEAKMLPMEQHVGATAASPPEATALWRVPATMAWDALVAQTTHAGFWNLACLSGIPGSVGAAPVQNVGAYGACLADCLHAVEAVDLQSGLPCTLDARDCGLAYRQSHFKAVWRHRYAITAVSLRLSRTPPVLCHPELCQLLRLQPGAQATGLTPPQVRQAVLALRERKAMVWHPNDANCRSVGSFFVNPTVPAPLAHALRARFPRMPWWPSPAADAAGGDTPIKLAAAWLIEAAGFARGSIFGPAGLSSHHALAIINRGGARAEDIVMVARRLRGAVRQTFGVTLTAEPTFIGFADNPLGVPSL